MADNALFEPSAGVPGAAPTNALLAAPPSMADAYEYHAQALQKWMAEQRASGIADGTIDPDSGWPTQKGVVDAIGQAAQGVMLGTTAPGFRAYHGSPHSFDAFDLGKIGTGEGAQAYGHGLYFADNEGVARSYRDALAPLGTQTAQGGTGAEGMAARALQRAKSPEEAAASLDYNLTVHKAANDGKIDPNFQAQIQEARRLILNPGARGHMYEVQVNADPAHFLDWDKPLSEQTPHVRQTLADLGVTMPENVFKVVPEGDRFVVHRRSGDGPNDFSRIEHGRSFATQADAQKAVDATAQMQGLNPTGGEIYRRGLPMMSGNAVENAGHLQRNGIPGIRYLDGGSRADGTGTSNHVVFDANTIAILRKYGIAGLIAGGGAAATQTPRQEPSP